MAGLQSDKARETQHNVNVLLIGNHALFMEFVASCLRRDSRLCVLGIAYRPDEVIDFARNHQLIHLALVDADATVNNCQVVADAMRVIQPRCRLLFLSALADDALITSALGARASGLVHKDGLPGTILTAIQEVLNGGSWFPESVRSRMVIDSLGIRLTPPVKNAVRRPAV
jgi:DNA-binding NarL/FixJ family response regulator